MELEEFLKSIEGFYDLNSSDQIAYLVYFLTKIEDNDGVQPIQVKRSFEHLHLVPYSNIPKYLSEKSQGTASKRLFLKRKDKYFLVRNELERIEKQLNGSTPIIEITSKITNLASLIIDNDENDFFQELAKCFSIKAYRASIIMSWNLALDHLYEYILKHKLAEFNTALAANTDRRVRISTISVKDDFAEIPENKFIEFCRSSRIISNDVRKILDVKLGIRNSAAHPSNIKILESKALDFIDDLTTNVVLKYNI